MASREGFQKLILRDEFEAWESEGNNIIDARDEGTDKEIVGQLSESYYDDGNFLMEGVQPTITSDVKLCCGDTNLQDGWK